MRRIIETLGVSLLLSAHMLAQIPEKIGWQGYLNDGDGPLNGPVNLVVSLYEAASGGTYVYRLDSTGVIASNGVVDVPLGPCGTANRLAPPCPANWQS